jgi:hypothetical protein
MKSRKHKLAPFVPLTKATIATPAWRALSHGARSLYAALKARYNTKLCNAVYLSIRKAKEELGSYSHIDNVGRWFRELEHYGFIRMVAAGCLGVEGHGKAPHWRLTEESYHGQPPTRDFEKWDGILFDKDSRPPRISRRGKYVRKNSESRTARPVHPVPHVRYTGGRYS